MKEVVLKLKSNTRIISVVKAALCLIIMATIIRVYFSDGVDSYLNYKDYSVRNDNTGGEWFDLSDIKTAEQNFIASGNLLDNVSLYYGNAEDRDVVVSVLSLDDKVLDNIKLNTASLSKNNWNEVGLSTDRLKRGREYKISIKSEAGLSGFIIGNGTAPEKYTDFYADGSTANGKLLLGIKQTYCYFNLASVFDLSIKSIYIFLLGLALCVSVVRFEEIYSAFLKEKKQGFSYALFFAVSLMLSYNPIDSIRTEVIDFKRVMGAGIIANVDVSRRISNFSRWFIIFGIVFLLLYMLANYYLGKDKSETQKKVVAFLNNLMVLANCNLILRCITYFKDSTSDTSIFYFSQNIIMVLAITTICYWVFSFDRFVDEDIFEQMIVSALSLSVALTVIWGRELGKGRVMLGVASVMIALVFGFCVINAKSLSKKTIVRRIMVLTVIASFIPVATSLYIELIHVMNQHDIFVAHPAKYYKIAFILGLFAFVSLLILIEKEKFEIKEWKNIVFPSLVAGVTCLSIQIPISKIYNPDIYEGANASILMSDFLNYGDIPIVQHYGGHMMTRVWEGILYALINNDYAGIVSPYLGLLNVVLAVLFYFLIAKIWNKEMGLLTTLLFPFKESFSYYGLGVLVCLAAMFYVRKNTIGRAAALWGAFVWCALYRLDLGFAFGLAVIITMLIYVIINKNNTAFKQLGITLIGWGAVGGIAWLIICLAKGVNPVNRLIEFWMITLSNQNWAYAGIGTVDNLLFAWGYIIVPFTMVLALLYTIFSKNYRDKIGNEKWILLLILNLSYFQNFSRGLVRHSLFENKTTTVFWSAYLFLAIFLAFYKDSMKWFLPSFMLLIILNELFLNPANFTSLPISDSAVSAPQSIIESWYPSRFYDEEKDIVADDGREFSTEWEKIKYSKEKVERIVLADDLVNYASEYDLLLKTLLDKNETFVDFINKTLLYSVLGYRCPVYVSQSPLQLSGDFTQEEFIKEIKDVPIVLMPVDGGNYRASNSNDGITNAYRYYKVYEYICSNYKPLCRYGDEYAIWCIPGKYDEYKGKISGFLEGREYVQDLYSADTIGKRNVELEKGEGDSVVVRFTGKDPMLTELQKVIDISGYIGLKLQVTVDYQTDMDGTMQLYYTTDEGEEYVAEKVANAQISGEGTATFTVPITEFTRLRLDTPEESTVTIKSMKAGHPVEIIDYGYDGPTENEDGAGNITYGYISALHNTSIEKLPQIWAEADEKHSLNNKALFNLAYTENYYTFDSAAIPQSDNGNYLKLTAAYDGVDTEGKYDDDDEEVPATIIFGQYKDGKFIEKYRYAITIEEGSHNYLIRCSTDYYWYLKQVNAVKIDTTGNLRNVQMSVLEGD